MEFMFQKVGETSVEGFKVQGRHQQVGIMGM